LRTISATLQSAQEAASGTPYIMLFFHSADGSTVYDYSSRLKQLEHHEEPYNDYATILLRNDDGAVADLRGYWIEIEYGFDTGVSEAFWAANTAYSVGDIVRPTTPNGYKYKCTVAGTSGATEPTWPTSPAATVTDGSVTWEQYAESGKEHSPTARLWVKNQQLISYQGHLDVLLELQGMWAVLREVQLRLGDPPFYSKTYETDTIYDIISAILSEAGFTLAALGSQDDGIINTLTPRFDINAAPVRDRFADCASIIYRLIQMTKCYLRPESGEQFRVIYPQSSDSVQKTYYSNQAHYFFEYSERRNVAVPNYIYTFANAGDDMSWKNYITATAVDTTWTTNYMTIPMITLASLLTTQTDADNRADAILTRIKAEELAGRGVIPHDCALELYDYVQFYDDRTGNTYPESNLTRVGGLVHRYSPGEYTLEVFLGGIETTISLDVPMVTPTKAPPITRAKPPSPPPAPDIYKPPVTKTPPPRITAPAPVFEYEPPPREEVPFEPEYIGRERFRARHPLLTYRFPEPTPPVLPPVSGAVTAERPFTELPPPIPLPLPVEPQYKIVPPPAPPALPYSAKVTAEMPLETPEGLAAFRAMLRAADQMARAGGGRIFEPEYIGRSRFEAQKVVEENLSPEEAYFRYS